MTHDAIDTTGGDLVPGWLERLAAVGWRVLVTIALAVVLIYIAVLLSTVTASVLIALIVAATFAPYTSNLRDRGWSRTKAAGVVSLVALLVLTATLTLLAVAFLPYVAEVIRALQAGGDAVAAWLVEIDAPQEVATLLGFIVDQIRGFFAGIAADIAGPIAALVTSLILGGFLTFYLLQDGDKAWAWLVAPIRGWRADAITNSGRVALDRVGGYLRGTAILAATDAISDFIFLMLLGVPLAGPLAVLVFVGGFIPYLGGFLSTTVLVLVTWSTNGPTDVVILLVLIAIMNIIQGNILAPMIYGKSLEVHPALVLIALPAGAALFGVMGLFAALPILAFALAIAPAFVLALDIDPAQRSAHSGLVPTWLDRLGQWSWRALVAIGLGAVVVAAAVRIPLVLLPVILGVVLAATLDPSADALRRRGWSRGVAAIAVTLGTVLTIVGIVVLTLITMVGPLQEMLATAEDGADQGILASLGLKDLVHAFTSGFLEDVVGLVSGLASLGVVLLLATLLTFYFLRDGEAAWNKGIARFNERRRTTLAVAGGRAAEVLGGYMIGTAVISLFGAATTAVLMIILGLPLALPIGVLAFFLGFIPYIGSFLATGLAFLVTLSVGETSDIVIMGVFTIVFNIAQGNFVAPLVYGKAVSLHPAIVLLAIPAGNQLAGIVGMFLVVPFAGVVAVTWRALLRVVDADEVEDEVRDPDEVVTAVVNPAGEPASPS
jgi:predicted PurR-regulated permease PerM